MTNLNLLDSIIGFESAYNAINNQLMQKISDLGHNKANMDNIYLDHLFNLKSICNFTKIKHLQSVSKNQTDDNFENEKLEYKAKHARILNFIPQSLLMDMERSRIALFIAWNKSIEKKTFCANELNNYLIYYKQYCEILKNVLDKKNNYDALLNFHHPRFSCEFVEGILKKISSPLKDQYKKYKDSFKNIKHIRIDVNSIKSENYSDILTNIKNNLFVTNDHDLYYTENNLTVFHDLKTQKNKTNNEFQEIISNSLITDIQNYLTAEFFKKTQEFEEYNTNFLSMISSYFITFYLLKSQKYADTLSNNTKRVLKQKGKALDSQNLYLLFNKPADGLTLSNCDETSKIFYHMIQYVIERDLINGVITAEDAPEIWMNGIKHYFGLEVKPEHILQNHYISYSRFGSCAFQITSMICGAMMFSQYESSTKDKEFNNTIIKQFFHNLTHESNVDYRVHASLDKIFDNINVFLEILKNRFK